MDRRGLGASHRRELIWAATVGIVLADSSVVTLGLPDILARFDTTVSGVAWVLTSFNVVLAFAVLPAAVLAARRGAARAAQVWAGGAAAFAAGSLLCAVAPSIGVRIAGRCVGDHRRAPDRRGQERDRLPHRSPAPELGAGTRARRGAAIVFIYAVLGGMKGITWTQVTQYTILIVAYLIPAWAIANELGDFPVPQVSFGEVAGELNALQREFGLAEYTEPFTNRPMQDVFLVVLALMAGTAGLPHIIIRFYTTRTVRAARYSAGWALLFIALLYTTAPAVAVFAKTNLLQDVANQSYAERPDWVRNWEEVGLVTFSDQNGDGVVNSLSTTTGQAELQVDPDIMVLANPEIAGLPAPVVGLVAAGGLAAALSTAAGLLLVIAGAVGHDLYFRRLRPGAGERERLRAGRAGVLLAVLAAGYFGVNPPAFVGQVVAFAFGLAASSFFPVIVLGIFWRRTSAAGAVAGMLTGITLTTLYMYFTIFEDMDHWLGVSPEGVGAVGMVINFAVTILVSRFTRPPAPEVQELVEEARHPRVGGEAEPALAGR